MIQNQAGWQAFAIPAQVYAVKQASLAHIHRSYVMMLDENMVDYHW